MVNARIPVLTLFLIALLTQTLSGVSAENTTITNLVYPSGSVSGGTTTVTFDLAYSGLTSTEGLIAAIVDPTTNDIAYGLASSTPDQCISLAGTQYGGRAACVWRLKSTSGTENLTFNLQFPSTHIQSYHFEAVSTIVTSGGNLLGVSQQPFAITGGTTFQLTVNTAYPVTLTVDGSTNASSPVELTPGLHVVSVPTLVQLDNFSRLRFDHWDDGSTQPDRTVNIRSDTTIAATFVHQYLLTLNSPHANVTGAGWYDVGSTVQFSVPPSLQMSGPLGAIGARLIFKGWYENGTRVTTANIGAVSMFGGHTLNAQWAPDYTIPLTALTAIAVVVGASAAVVTRRRKRGKVRRRARRGKAAAKRSVRANRRSVSKKKPRRAY